jgi:hypothetical protein
VATFPSERTIPIRLGREWRFCPRLAATALQAVRLHRIGRACHTFDRDHSIPARTEIYPK